MEAKEPPDHQSPTRTEAEGETLDMPEGLGTFSQGQILGERYQILETLGRGGMGEVWKVFDLKLRVEVALKALRPEFFKSERRLELLRQEVRAAREVVSPNVCRIFDTLPRDELLAKLRTLTNLRATRDPESPTGWKIEVGPFPGWKTVPEW